MQPHKVHQLLVLLCRRPACAAWQRVSRLRATVTTALLLSCTELHVLLQMPVAGAALLQGAPGCGPASTGASAAAALPGCVSGALQARRCRTCSETGLFSWPGWLACHMALASNQATVARRR